MPPLARHLQYTIRSLRMSRQLPPAFDVMGLALGKAHMLWSGRRDLNSRLQPWQGCALPTELRPQAGAKGQNRTGDTVIFSHVLYQLSYLGPLHLVYGGKSYCNTSTLSTQHLFTGFGRRKTTSRNASRGQTPWDPGWGPKLAEPTGLEPAISGVTGRRVRPTTPRFRLALVS
jgi:hypothetical protein